MLFSGQEPQRRLNTRARLMAVAVLGCYAGVPAWAQSQNVALQSIKAEDLKQHIGSFKATNVVGGVTVDNLTSRTMAEAASFHVLAGQTFTINQGVNDAFWVRVTGIGSGASKIFQQSVIEGRITSFGKGQFGLINPAGTIIKPGAVIDVGRFVAALGITDTDFLAGRLNFHSNDGSGKIVNQGTIETPSGGSVYLVGTEVSNEGSGIIKTPQGETILAAGQKVELIDTGTPGVKVQITGKPGNVTNLGQILADAGRIGMVGAIVRNSGTLNVSSGIDSLKAVAEGGRVFLRASQDAYVDGKGRIVATGTKGGKVEVLGNRVAVMDEAEIDVSGTHGGGTILVGGDYQGKNPDVQNAQITYFGKDAKLKADATDNGDGGKVIVWADDITRAYGTISARGGAFGGNGGFVETSGHRYLDFRANVDRRAPMGKAGTLLLDPSDLTIVDSGDSFNNGTFNGGIFSGANTPSTISWVTIGSQLDLGNVQVTTSGYGGSGDININGSFVYYDTNSLSFLAHRDIVFDIGSHINNGDGGPGEIKLVAGWNGDTATPSVMAGTGSIKMKDSSYVDATGGNVTVLAGKDLSMTGARILSGKSMVVSVGGAINVESGSSINAGTLPGYLNGTQTITAGGNITVYGGAAAGGAQTFIKNTSTGQQTVTSTGGAILIKATGNAGYPAVADISSGGSQVVSAAGNIDLQGGSQTNSYARIFSAGNQSVSTSGDLTITGGQSGTGSYATVRANGSQAIRANNIKLQAGNGGGANAILQAGNTQTIQAVNLTLLASSSRALITANHALNIVAGSITSSGGSISSMDGISATVAGNIRLNDGSTIVSGSPGGVNLTLEGTNSSLYLNESGAMTPSYILAGGDGESRGPASTNIVFNKRVSGGVVIDGTETTTTNPGKSGFFVPDMETMNQNLPATAGAGLSIVYRGTATTGSSGASSVTDSIINTMPTPGASPVPVIAAAPRLPPPGTTDGGKTPGNQTLGGGSDQFGGESPGSGASGEGSKADNGKDKKDDKKSSDASGEKKDDKPNGKKPMGKCNA